MASVWNLWVWLVWIVGDVVRRYIDILIIIITFPSSFVLALFWQQQPYFFILKMFFVLVYVIFVPYSKCCSKNIRNRSKIEFT